MDAFAADAFSKDAIVGVDEGGVTHAAREGRHVKADVGRQDGALHRGFCVRAHTQSDVVAQHLGVANHRADDATGRRGGRDVTENDGAATTNANAVVGEHGVVYGQLDELPAA